MNRPNYTPNYFSQFDAGTLEGLILLAQERNNVAAQQVPGILAHIAEHEAHLEEQHALIQRFQAQYDKDTAFIEGAIAFIQGGGQQPPAPQPPQQMNPGAFQPTHHFPPFPQPALPQQLPQQPQQQFEPALMPQYAPPNPGYVPAPPQMQAAQPHHFPQAQQPSQSRVVQGQGQPPFPQAPNGNGQSQNGGQDTGHTPLPFTDADAMGVTMATTGARRSHLIPNPNGVGFIPDPNFVDEFGMRPSTEITDEMRAAWARDQKPEVLVIHPGEEGHVPSGGANLKVKVRGNVNGSESASDSVDAAQEQAQVEFVEPGPPAG